MRIAVLALALLPGAAFAGERSAPLATSHLALPATPKSQCQNPRNEHAVINPLNMTGPARVGPLGKEPRANLYLGVQRLEDGCDLPVKIGDEMGDKQR